MNRVFNLLRLLLLIVLSFHLLYQLWIFSTSVDTLYEEYWDNYATDWDGPVSVESTNPLPYVALTIEVFEGQERLLYRVPSIEYDTNRQVPTPAQPPCYPQPVDVGDMIRDMRDYLIELRRTHPNPEMAVVPRDFAASGPTEEEYLPEMLVLSDIFVEMDDDLRWMEGGSEHDTMFQDAYDEIQRIIVVHEKAVALKKANPASIFNTRQSEKTAEVPIQQTVQGDDMGSMQNDILVDVSKKQPGSATRYTPGILKHANEDLDELDYGIDYEDIQLEPTAQSAPTAMDVCYHTGEGDGDDAGSFREESNARDKALGGLDTDAQHVASSGDFVRIDPDDPKEISQDVCTTAEIKFLYQSDEAAQCAAPMEYIVNAWGGRAMVQGEL